MGFYGGFPPGRPPVPEPNSGQGPAPPILPRMRPPFRPPTLAAPTLGAPPPGMPPVLGQRTRPPLPGAPPVMGQRNRPPLPGAPPNMDAGPNHPFEHPPDVNFAARKARKRAMGGDPMEPAPALSAPSAPGPFTRVRRRVEGAEPEIEKAMRRKRDML